MKTPSVSLVISTYNWKEALHLCLLSAARQTVLPVEAVVADDGSRDDTRALLDALRPTLPFPLLHAWQEDRGFRKAAAMNRAFALCSGDYIVQIDGDILMERHFLADHLSEARPGTYLHGSRGKLTPALTAALCAAGRLPRLTPWSTGVTRRLNTVRCPLLTPFFRHYKEHGLERGCNLSFWRSDLLAVNGYDERMTGYGGEDIDLPLRLRHAGVRKQFIKFKAVEYHLHHAEHATKSDMSANERIVREHLAHRTVRIDQGIDQYIPR